MSQAVRPAVGISPYFSYGNPKGVCRALYPHLFGNEVSNPARSGPEQHPLASTGADTNSIVVGRRNSSLHNSTTVIPCDMPLATSLNSASPAESAMLASRLLQWPPSVPSNSIKTTLHDRRESASPARSTLGNCRPRRSLRAIWLHSGTSVRIATRFPPVLNGTREPGMPGKSSELQLKPNVHRRAEAQCPSASGRLS